jgi:nucleoside phosphorylase
MPEPQSLTLPLRSADTAALGAPNAATNVNQGAGNQTNYIQAGRHGNSQYNAEKDHRERSASMATSGSPSPPPKSRGEFQIAIICALRMERDTVEALMTRNYSDEGYSYGKANHDNNVYTLGELGSKPIVLVAPRDVGTTSTRQLETSLRISFPNILYAFVVGIAGAAPLIYDGDRWIPSNIQLGDVVISTQVIEYDFGKTYENGFRRKTDVENALPRAPAEVTNFVNKLSRGHSAAYRRILRKTNSDIARLDEIQDVTYYHPGPDRDNVFPLTYRHKHQDPTTCTTCDACTEWYHEVCAEALEASCEVLGCKPSRSVPVHDTKIHFGRYASGNSVMKSGFRRDILIKEDNVVGFDMEGAGAWEGFGTIVVKGVVDYADSHKNKGWREYPAARAALCAAAMIEEIELPDRPLSGE